MKKRRFFLCALILCCAIVGICSISGSYKTSNVKQYAEMKNKVKGKAFSELEVFPKEIDEMVKNKVYFIRFGRKTLDYFVEVYLECDYEEQKFQEELERLSKIEAIDEKYQLHHLVVEDIKNFNYPAYVMIFQNNYTYEYALIDEKNQRIVYVYLQHVDYDDVKMDHNYLDKAYKRYMENGNSEIGYNQYAFSSYEYEEK